jgi:hypothetical protein
MQVVMHEPLAPFAVCETGDGELLMSQPKLMAVAP